MIQLCPIPGSLRFTVSAFAIILGSLSISTFHDLPEYCEEYVGTDCSSYVLGLDIFYTIQGACLVAFGVLHILVMSYYGLIQAIESSAASYPFLDQCTAVLMIALVGFGSTVILAFNVIVRNHCHGPQWFPIAVAFVNILFCTIIGWLIIGFVLLCLILNVRVIRKLDYHINV